MKPCIIVTFLICVSICGEAKGQSQEAQQLLLNWEKLAQLKSILNNMYEGYKVISKGYNAVKDLAEGNFSLHQEFLDGLWQVSPIVKKYKRIAEIVDMQKAIVRDGRQAFKDFNSSGALNPEELQYMGKVYCNLLRQSIKNLDELFMVITVGTLRMDDNERLQAIDRLFDSVQDQLSFLRSFNNGTRLLLVQRIKEKEDVDLESKLLDGK
jgi:hypothetical protein